MLEQECESAIQYEIVSTYFPWMQSMYIFVSTPHHEAFDPTQPVSDIAGESVLEKQLLVSKFEVPIRAQVNPGDRLY